MTTNQEKSKKTALAMVKSHGKEQALINAKLYYHKSKDMDWVDVCDYINRVNCKITVRNVELNEFYEIVPNDLDKVELHDYIKHKLVTGKKPHEWFMIEMI